MKLKWNFIVVFVVFLSFGNAAFTKTNKRPFLSQNWGLENAYKSHINVRKAWTFSRGSENILVAFIDTGIDPNHPDFKNNKWNRPGTKNEYGWDFVLNKKNPKDSHGHGSHVGGIALSVAPKVKIMAIRYYSRQATGSTNLSNTVKAIHYAIDNGAHIINYSAGGSEFSAMELKAIKRAEQKGILFIAAAGNESNNLDKVDNKYYPASYRLSNIISVAATNIHNQLLASSNWGKKLIDVAAPGGDIHSALPVKVNKGRKNLYGYLSGTSQATAFVTGLAALILSKNPHLKPHEVKKIIVNTVDKLPHLKDKVRSGGRINAYAALQKVTQDLETTLIAAKNKKTKGALPYGSKAVLNKRRIPARNR